MSQDLLVLMVGHTAAGKNRLLEEYGKRWKFETTVSWTTRAPKADEVDGQHYHFRNVAEFEDLISRDGFAEHAKVHGHYYGTTRGELDRARRAGGDVVFDLDIQGARQLKTKYPDAVIIFVAFPSMEGIERRIAKRGRGEQKAETEVRLRTTAEELRRVEEADFIIENRDGQLDLTIQNFARLLSQLRASDEPSSMFRDPVLIDRCKGCAEVISRCMAASL